MLHRLCGPPSIPLSFMLAHVLPRRRAYWVTCGTAGANPQHLAPIVYGWDYQGISSCLLPQLSSLSVSCRPGGRLRHWCSSRYLRISPLHREFRHPLRHSSPAVSHDLRRLSRRLSRRTHRAAYTPFTPSDSGQRSPPTYYRGCWHVVSRGFLGGYRHVLLPLRQGFTTRRPSSPTRRRCVRLSPIAQDSLLLPPVGVWPVSQCQCGRPPSQAGYPSSPW